MSFWKNTLKVTIILLNGMVMFNVYAEEFKIDKTSENIPKKALITKQTAKIFKNSEGEQSEKAPFMQLYFLMSPSKNNRIPVSNSFSDQKTKPDGWLDKGDFEEWNTIQMINFEGQQGRDLVRIYATAECAKKFAEGSLLGECQEQGREPKNSSSTKQHKFLIPVFQRDKDNYYAGFIGIQEDKVIKPVESKLGYDLVLVVDSTLSMTKYFRPTMTALESFIQHVQSATKDNNLNATLRIGLLFYRDRDLKNKNCTVGYLIHWAQALTEKVDSVVNELKHAEASSCDDMDDPEAVFDAINRAILDTKWEGAHFKNILLIGDAPPHPKSSEKNPFQFSVESISKLASENNIRFLTFKIEDKNYSEFKELALSTEEGRKGRFQIINKGDVIQFEQDLQKSLLREWNLVMNSQKRLQSNEKGLSSLHHEPDNTNSYEYPIIVSNLRLPFVSGWVPQKLKGIPVFSEYVFMKKADLQLFSNNLDSINISFTDSQSSGGEMLIKTIRDALASQLNISPHEIFRSGESLETLLRKTYVLPFRSELLSFTPEQINTFKPSEYQRISDILSKKVMALRAFSSDPKNIHILGDTQYLYVPRSFFP